MEQLEASILGTVFRNEENGYSVLSVRSGRDECTVIGVMPEMAPGEQAIFTGEWTDHKQYGHQFRCVACEILEPTTLLGIERFLASGIIKGIKAFTAAQIVEHFGEETLAVLSEHPLRLLEISGIGKKKAAMIAESFREHMEIRRAMVFLQAYGIPADISVRIAQHYGDRTSELLRQNPYRICDEMERIGFRTADKIGIALGVAPDSDMRVQSALKYALTDASYTAGHVYLPEAELLRTATELLQVPEALCQRNLTALLLRRRLVAEADQDGSRRIYTPFFYEAEKEVAGRIRELMAAVRPGRYSHAEKAISAFERRNQITFSSLQRTAIVQALETGVVVITGGPGTGKTTLIKCILELLSRENTILLCAPTGRAAKRMTEATGAESKTIHRLLEYSGETGDFTRNEEDPLDADCIIADEASMIDLALMQSLLRAVLPGTRLILVGDADQLPSVGPGNVLRDILESGVVPCVRLKEIFRQSENSRIALNAHLINNGEMPQMNGKGTDFFFERKPYAREAAATILSLVTARLPVYLKYATAGELKDPVRQKRALDLASRNIQVLAPAKKGECGVHALNTLLQNALNPLRAGAAELTWGENVFRQGDKVIQTRNNYDLTWIRRAGRAKEVEGNGVFNGDIGFITAIDTGDNRVTVLFDEEREVVYSSEDLNDLSLAYCLSVHKSQGSEFPVVILPVVGAPPLLQTRNLFYTAVTRARSLVVLVGTENVIRMMVQNDHIARRYTALASRLQEWTPED